MSWRPKHPRPDANQPAAVALLRESGLAVVVTAALPGATTPDNPLDYFVVRPPRPGDPPAPVIVAWSGEGVMRYMREHPEHAIVQVEMKMPGAALEPHQERYLVRMGWTREVWR